MFPYFGGAMGGGQSSRVKVPSGPERQRATSRNAPGFRTPLPSNGRNCGPSPARHQSTTRASATGFSPAPSTTRPERRTAGARATRARSPSGSGTGCNRWMQRANPGARTSAVRARTSKATLNAHEGASSPAAERRGSTPIAPKVQARTSPALSVSRTCSSVRRPICSRRTTRAPATGSPRGSRTATTSRFAGRITRTISSPGAAHSRTTEANPVARTARRESSSTGSPTSNRPSAPATAVRAGPSRSPGAGATAKPGLPRGRAVTRAPGTGEPSVETTRPRRWARISSAGAGSGTTGTPASGMAPAVSTGGEGAGRCGPPPSVAFPPPPPRVAQSPTPRRTTATAIPTFAFAPMRIAPAARAAVPAVPVASVVPGSSLPRSAAHPRAHLSRSSSHPRASPSRSSTWARLSRVRTVSTGSSCRAAISRGGRSS